jgi:hypothetical protein
MDVPLMSVSLIDVPLMACLPLACIPWTRISWRTSHRRVCCGRLISTVAITGIVIEWVRGPVRYVDWLWWIIIICEALDFRSLGCGTFLKYTPPWKGKNHGCPVRPMMSTKPFFPPAPGGEIMASKQRRSRSYTNESVIVDVRKPVLLPRDWKVALLTD